MSRLDCVLSSAECEEMWGQGSLWILARDVSDNFPIMVNYPFQPWGLSPFRFNFLVG